jgi:lipoprotein-anchoring transpeptidase ErfK/SrfK
VVVVDLQHHRTHVLQWHNNEVEDVVDIPNAVGKEATPTPEMRTSVASKRLDPVWTPPVSIDPMQQPFEPYSVNHANPLGVAYISLNTNLGAYGLHGTNRPDQIGTGVSHGCIRHYNQDIMRVFPLVQRGTPVYLTSHIEGLTVLPKDFQLT